MMTDEEQEALDLEAVKENGYALKHVKNQTDEICLAAVKEQRQVLQFVKNQTEEICLAARERSPDEDYRVNPCLEIKFSSIRRGD